MRKTATAAHAELFILTRRTLGRIEEPLFGQLIYSISP